METEAIIVVVVIAVLILAAVAYLMLKSRRQGAVDREYRQRGAEHIEASAVQERVEADRKHEQAKTTEQLAAVEAERTRAEAEAHEARARTAELEAERARE